MRWHDVCSSGGVPIRSLRAFLGIVVAFTSSGCTIAGIGIGAAVDASSRSTYKRHPPSDARRVELGARVRVRRTHGAPLEGRFVGLASRGPKDGETSLVVETPDGLALVSESELRGLDTRRPKYGWLYGGGIGLVLDIVALTTLTAVTASSIGDLSNSPAAHENGGGW